MGVFVSFSAPFALIILNFHTFFLNDCQFTMELAGTELGNVPKFYSMDMSKDFVPMSIFSESQGDYANSSIFVLYASALGSY